MTISHDVRNRELAQIHIAKAQLGLDDATYRDMLWSIGRVRSAGDLDFTGRKRVLEHLRLRGFKPAAKFHGKPFEAQGRPGRNPEWGWVDSAAEDRRPMLRKIIMIAKSGGYGQAYVDGTCAKMFGIARLELVAPDQLHKLVAALALHQQRRAKDRA